MQVHLTGFVLPPLFRPSRAMDRAAGREALAGDSDVTLDLLRHVEVPKPDAVAWEDTEIDVRRVVL